MPTQIWNNLTFDTPMPDGACVAILGTQEPDSRVNECNFDGLALRWGLKMPGNIGTVFEDCRFTGSAGRAVDMVKGSNVVFRRCTFLPCPARKPTTSKWSLAKTCDIGAKGGVQVTLQDCVLQDILIGDHTIYDNPNLGPKANVTMTNCRRLDGGPVIARIFNGELHTDRADILHWPLWVTKLYFWYENHFGDTRTQPV